MTSPLRSLTLSLLRDRYAVLRVPPDSAVPAWASRGEFFSITHAHDELSIVCPIEPVPVAQRPAAEWHALKVRGPFQFDEIGVLACLATPLAAAQIGIFVVSTFDTDYLLIQAKDTRRAIAVLQSAGHTIIENDSNSQEVKENEE